MLGDTSLGAALVDTLSLLHPDFSWSIFPPLMPPSIRLMLLGLLGLLESSYHAGMSPSLTH